MKTILIIIGVITVVRFFSNLSKQKEAAKAKAEFEQEKEESKHNYGKTIVHSADKIEDKYGKESIEDAKHEIIDKDEKGETK